MVGLKNRLFVEVSDKLECTIRLMQDRGCVFENEGCSEKRQLRSS